MAHVAPRSLRFGIGASLLALGLVVTGCSSGGGDTATDEGFVAGDPSAPEQTDLTFAMYRQATAAPVFGAKDSGAEKEFGITVDASWVESSSAGMNLLLGGDAQLTYSSYWGVVDAMVQGMDVAIVSTMFNFGPGVMTMETMPDSGISSLKDLLGKKVAVPALNSAQHNRLEYAFLDAGIDSSTVEYVPMPFGEVTAALVNGTIDAGAVAGPVLTVLKDEYDSKTVLDFAGGLFEGHGEGGIITSGEFARANPNTIAAFQCVWADGVAAVEDDELFGSILESELGFAPELIPSEIEKKPLFQTTADPASLAKFPEIMTEIGTLDQPVDLSDIIIPQPESC
ncbi:ABC transporter substrate-binding protein [Microbacterium sp. A204]|uniref:ABC transporter substrate-binding protein n=1 Tax=Microbacterium sp. A204 TaxID=3457321 RepID=UPI003FD5554D